MFNKLMLCLTYIYSAVIYISECVSLNLISFVLKGFEEQIFKLNIFFNHPHFTFLNTAALIL